MDVDVAARLRGVINKLSRQFNASATGEGLTPSQASALGLIAWRGPLSLAELADIEGLNPTMVSRIIGKLDEAGLARRVQNPQDLRAGLVDITEAGTSMHERIKAERGKVVAACLDGLPEADREAIVGALPALEALAGALRSVPASRD
jgi:DNA-binding MarR family transcriptional regulator